MVFNILLYTLVNVSPENSKNALSLNVMDTLSGEATLPFSFLPPFGMGVNSKRICIS